MCLIGPCFSDNSFKTAKPEPYYAFSEQLAEHVQLNRRCASKIKYTNKKQQQ